MICKLDGCKQEAHARGYCNTHYARYWRNGVMAEPRKRGPQVEDPGYCPRCGRTLILDPLGNWCEPCQYVKPMMAVMALPHRGVIVLCVGGREHEMTAPEARRVINHLEGAIVRCEEMRIGGNA